MARVSANSVHLDLADGQYVTAGLLPEPTVVQVAATLEPLVRDAREIYAPAGIGNREHALVRNAVLALRPDAMLYADLPYALKTELGGFNLPSDANAGERLGVDVSLDAATLNAKLEAVGEYRTQLAQLVRYFGDFLNTDGLGRERFWRAVGS